MDIATQNKITHAHERLTAIEETLKTIVVKDYDAIIEKLTGEIKALKMRMGKGG